MKQNELDEAILALRGAEPLLHFARAYAFGEMELAPYTGGSTAEGWWKTIAMITDVQERVAAVLAKHPQGGTREPEQS